jgi:4-diphosphocytidyl-2-C-methyl-D-erythritol kinase
MSTIPKQPLPVVFDTPAKINIVLFVQRKRPDGYHELVLDLLPVSLCDRIRLTPSDVGGLSFRCNLERIDPEHNLVVDAVRKLEAATGRTFSLTIDLHKRIPLGAGLGGGSGNAAGMLIMMDRLFSLQLPSATLLQLAVELGADVPFFLDPKPAIGRGFGDRLTALTAFDPLFLLLLYPGFPISTGEAYQHCRISARQQLLPDYHLWTLARQSPDLNDFWPPLVARYPMLETCRQALKQHNALYAGLTGSGSTVFGVFADRDHRDRAYSDLKHQPRWTLFPAETINHFRYQPIIETGDIPCGC